MSRTRTRARRGAPATGGRRGASTAGRRSAPPGARRNRPRPSPLYSAAPPAVALLVSSPAILAAMDGSTDPINAFTIVAVSLTAAWLLSAVGVKVADAVPARVDEQRRSPMAAVADDSPGPVALGRIEPIRVPAAHAIPGTPPPSSETEGPLP